VINHHSRELAFLYEISSLHWPGSPAELFDQVVEKAVRLFAIERAALVLYEEGKTAWHTWGFGRRRGKTLQNLLETAREAKKTYFRELGRPPLGRLYLEREECFAENERRLLDVMSGRLANILQLQRWEAQSQKLRERFEQIFQNMPGVGAFFFDRAGRALHSNREAQKIFGRELLHRSNGWLSLIQPAVDFQKLLARTWKTGRVTEPGEWRIKTARGDRRWTLLTLVPVKQDGKVVEVFCMFLDLTERKQMEEELRRLSIFDSLTGLYNRNYFEQTIRLLDEKGIRPVTVLICDLDGLKAVNDCLGHRQGDDLLQKAAALIQKVFPGEKAFRIGGDEFAVIMPAKNREAGQKARLALLQSSAADRAKSRLVPLHISVGVGSTGTGARSVYEAYKQADDQMYRDKSRHYASGKYDLGRCLLSNLFRLHPGLKRHSLRVKELAELLGKAAGLSADQMKQLLLLAEAHDVGKAVFPARLLRRREPPAGKEGEEIRRHCEAGWRIAKNSPSLAPVADMILQHHEWWNGQGHPQGLKGEEIHLLSRILAIADACEHMTSRRGMSAGEILTELAQSAGSRFDPRLTDIFIAAGRKLGDVFFPAGGNGDETVKKDRRRIRSEVFLPPSQPASAENEEYIQHKSEQVDKIKEYSQRHQHRAVRPGVFGPLKIKRRHQAEQQRPADTDGQSERTEKPAEEDGQQHQPEQNQQSDKQGSGQYIQVPPGQHTVGAERCEHGK